MTAYDLVREHKAPKGVLLCVVALDQWRATFLIECTERRQGHGTKALTELCQLANLNSVAFEISVAPDTDWNYYGLRDWYKRFGFISTGPGQMLREPQE